MSQDLTLSKEKLNIIVAYTSEHRYISYQNDLPWQRKIKADKNFLRQIIKPENNEDFLLIMGRVTYESIPKFKNVRIAVVTQKTSKKDSEEQNVVKFPSFDEAISYGKEKRCKTIIFGGQGIYEEAIKHPHKLFCTVIEDSELPGDRIFPFCNTKLENVNLKVEDFLLSRNVKKTWEIENSRFHEDSYVFDFFVGETNL